MGTDLLRVARPDGSGGFIDRSLTVQSIFNGTPTSSGGLAFYEDYSNGETTGDGTSRTLASLGYSDVTADAAWPLTAAFISGGITASTWTIDDVTLYEAHLSMEQAGGPHQMVATPGKRYVLANPNGYVLIPRFSADNSTLDSERFIIDGSGCMFYNTNGSATAVFDRYPANQAEAGTWIDTAIIMGNFKINAGSATYGIRLCATTGGVLENIMVNGSGIGFRNEFCLFTSLYNCRTNGQATCFSAVTGTWSGAGASTAGSQMYYYGCRARVASGTHWSISGGDTHHILNCVAEGTGTAVNAVVYNTTGSTVSKSIVIKNMHLEQDCSDGAFKLIGNGNVAMIVEDCYPQGCDILAHNASSSGTNVIHLIRIGNHSGSNWILRNTSAAGNAWNFVDTMIQGNPTTPDTIVDTATYPDVWDLSGSFVAPNSAKVHITPRIL